MPDKTCKFDPTGNGTYKSIEECNKNCHPDAENCTPGTDGNLPYPVTDGKTVYTSTKQDKYGTYKFKKVSTESIPACQLLKCGTGSKLANYKGGGGIWCDPADDDGKTPCTSDMLKDSKNAFPGDPYKGTFADANASWNISYVEGDNTKQYCKFNTCNQPSYKLGPDGTCFNKCNIIDQYALTTDENCNILTCSKGKPKQDGRSCDIGSTCTSVQFATSYDTNCVPTECSDPNDPRTVYTVVDKACKGTACTPQSEDLYNYTNTGTLGQCVQGNTCIPDSDDNLIKYDPNNNCNADCSDSYTCRSFIGVDQESKFLFSCNSNGRICKVRDDGSGWGGCGSLDFPTYGPKGDGTCGKTIFEQRSRFEENNGCVTCIGGVSGTNCNPWQTDKTRCTYKEGCSYGESLHLGMPEDALNACVTAVQKADSTKQFSDEKEKLSSGEYIRRISYKPSENGYTLCPRGTYLGTEINNNFWLKLAPDDKNNLNGWTIEDNKSLNFTVPSTYKGLPVYYADTQATGGQLSDCTSKSTIKTGGNSKVTNNFIANYDMCGNMGCNPSHCTTDFNNYTNDYLGGLDNQFNQCAYWQSSPVETANVYFHAEGKQNLHVWTDRPAGYYNIDNNSAEHPVKYSKNTNYIDIAYNQTAKRRRIDAKTLWAYATSITPVDSKQNPGDIHISLNTGDSYWSMVCPKDVAKGDGPYPIFPSIFNKYGIVKDIFDIKKMSQFTNLLPNSGNTC